MPKKKPSQPELIREERTEYIVTPEEQARKEAYRQRLREFLQDPASRQIEGFPIGDDEAILALSDPPYYTACPNPFLGEIIQQWTEERDANQKSEVVNRKYHREPFATDVSEGKNDPIYNAHSYHTKVPHKAIMRYILHYTEPGDIVFDGFCGTGMTGVAAQLCGAKKVVESLGYRVTDDGKIYEGDKLISQLGARKAVLNDLSPAATFIAYNYNTPVDVSAFDRDAQRILQEVEQECGWMYETKHPSGGIGKINFTIWSDVFVCPECNVEMIFWDVAVDKEKGEVRETWQCPSCGTQLAKSKHKGVGAIKVERAWETIYDLSIKQTVRRTKQAPVIINYSIGKKRYEKRPDADDFANLQKIEQNEITYPFPYSRMPDGDNLMYSELNVLTEAWLKIFTNSGDEAIINKTQKKDLISYLQLMESSFREFYRILKPGHWMTVEFHNSKNAVWNSIQEAVLRAGFVIADVSILEKTHKTFKQVTSANSVKKDLAITAYRPNDNLEERFRLEAGTSDGAWDFVRYHLTQLPHVVEKNDEIEVVAERQAFLLFDRMVAFHIQRGASVPLSAGEFYAGLKQKFVERDGMYFLPDQVAEYDTARLRLGKVAQLSFMVNDEKTAIQWLRQQLDPTLGGEPQTFADLQPTFMRGSNQAKHEQMPELGVILEQNFLEDAEGHWRAPDPSKATDLERLRLKALLREFALYAEGKVKLKQFRSEAVRAGFAEAYKKREYKVILEVAGRLPESVLHEDPDLLMYFDTATLRAEQNP